MNRRWLVLGVLLTAAWGWKLNAAMDAVGAERINCGTKCSDKQYEMTVGNAAHVAAIAIPATLVQVVPPARVRVAGETNDQRDARMAWWRKARFGMFIHWGPISLKGAEISWSRANSNPQCPNNGPIPVAEYDNLYKRFNPTKFNARQWVAIAKAAGMKYMVLTAKHCDGFLLWDSKVDDYNIMHTPFKRDVCAELAQAAHAAGMRIGWYFSPMDWRDPDCRNAKNAEFVKRMQAELKELLTNYGKIDLLWFDTDGRSSPWDQERTYALVRKLQPHIIINKRLDYGRPDAGALGSAGPDQPEFVGPRGDYDTPEQTIGGFDNQHPWESCMTTSRRGQWSWGGPDDGVKTFAECLNMLIGCACGDGNLLLDVGPMPTGEIAPEQVNVIKEMGTWLAKNGKSIYGTRGGPYRNGGWGGATCKGNTVYLHVAKWNGDRLVLPALKSKIVKCTNLTNPRAAPALARTEQAITLTLAADQQDPLDTVIQLELDAPAAGEFINGQPLDVPEPVVLRLDSPLDYQVFQRQTPTEGRVRVRGRAPAGADELEVQIHGDWRPVVFNKDDGTFDAELSVPPGGWYTCRAQVTGAGSLLATAEAPHVGVGEVFVVAGQSNAGNHGEEKLSTKTGLVAAFDGICWQPAHDPQPGASGEGGSFMPPFGEAIAERFKVPVGIVACGIGSTSVREWLPKGARFPNPPTLVGRVQQLPSGEWESKGEAFAMLTACMKQLGPRGARAAQKSLRERGTALEGLDTNAPKCESREHNGQGVHFSGKGLLEHAARWMEKVAPWTEAQLTDADP